jgi:hypothetical protein
MMKQQVIIQRGSARSPAQDVHASCGVNPDTLIPGMMRIDCTFLVRALFTLWIEPEGQAGEDWLKGKCDFLTRGDINDALAHVGQMRPLVMECFFNEACDALRGESTQAITSCCTDGLSWNFIFQELRPVATTAEYQKVLPYVTREMLAFNGIDVVVFDPG